MLLFQTSREIIFSFQHFIQVCFYFLGKKLGGHGPPRPLPLLRHCESSLEGEIVNLDGFCCQGQRVRQLKDHS